MLTGTTLFTGLINSADVTGVLIQLGYVVAGIIVVLFVLAPFFLAKYGFGFILAKVQKMFGGGK